MNLRLLKAGYVTSYRHQSGDVRELIEPAGLATHRQLHLLNRRGLLAVVEPGQAVPLTKAEAAYAIDATTEAAA